MRTLYDSLFEPYAKYCIEVRGSAANCPVSTIHRVQKAAVRAVFVLPYDAHTAVYFRESAILTVFELHRYQILLLMYMAVKQNYNSNLFHSLISHFEIHLHNTRSADKLLLPHFQLSASQRSSLYLGPKFWNSIPDHVIGCTSYSSFKMTSRNISLTDQLSTFL